MKKAISITLILSVVICMFAGLSLTVSAETDGYYTYSVSGGLATITGVDNTISGNVTIPSTLGGYSVASIGDDAFVSCKGLTSIKIPNSVKSIGERAFQNCKGIKSVKISNTLKSIGDNAFENCKSLSSMTIPDSVTIIGSCAFSSCTGLKSITLSNNITSINNRYLL